MDQPSEILQPVNIETSSRNFNKIAERYGFVETPEMLSIRKKAIGYLRDGDLTKFQEAYIVYDREGEKHIATISPDKPVEQDLARVGAMLLKASMYYLGGDTITYSEEMSVVHWFAGNALAKHRETFD